MEHRSELATSSDMIKIRDAQKQALIDNLQLEITERARKLRAQYALQAQGLRTRLEMRVNRIPQALRKANMQELVDKYTQQAQQTARAPSPAKAAQSQTLANTNTTAGVKRSSDAFASSDKENANPSNALENPKKRVKTATTATVPKPAKSATATTGNARTVSKKLAPGTVLSPKSNNSRTFPHSPFKSTSPMKAALPRPTSPAKPLPQAFQSQARAPSRQTKRPVTAAAPPSPVKATALAPEPISTTRVSTGSDSSAGTTVVRTTKPSAVARKAAPAAGSTTTTATKKGTIKSAISSLTGSKRGAAAKKEAASAAAAAVATASAGGRVLRKRG